MSVEERLELIREIGEEIVEEEELKRLLEEGKELVAYDGFEPSGKIHIAQGLLRAININKMIKAGVKFKMWIADWHALANNKLGGDLQKIQTTGRYFLEIWKAAGLTSQNVEFLWASDMVKNSDYWKLVLQVGKTNGLGRFIRTAEMMGRRESLDTLTGANIIYSCMQIADIFMLGAKITQLGMDQRKLNMLAREIGPQLGFWKPVVISHHMLMGLSRPPEKDLDKTQRSIELKMSKSLPDSAIFMTDTPEEVNRKIEKSYCPPQQVTENPVLEYCRYIIFEKFPELNIPRLFAHGGDLTIKNYQELSKLYEGGKIHPQDLKKAAAHYLNLLLDPVRKYFEENEQAKKLKEEVETFTVTR